MESRSLNGSSDGSLRIQNWERRPAGPQTCCLPEQLIEASKSNNSGKMNAEFPMKILAVEFSSQQRSVAVGLRSEGDGVETYQSGIVDEGPTAPLKTGGGNIVGSQN